MKKIQITGHWTNRETTFNQFFKEFYGETKTVSVPESTRKRNLFLLSNKNLALRESARSLKLVRFSYKRLDGKVKAYLGEFYSVRSKRTSKGYRTYAYIYHRTHLKEHQCIHSFILSRIRNVLVTDIKFRPRWKVEPRSVR